MLTDDLAMAADSGEVGNVVEEEDIAELFGALYTPPPIPRRVRTESELSARNPCGLGKNFFGRIATFFLVPSPSLVRAQSELSPS